MFMERLRRSTLPYDLITLTMSLCFLVLGAATVRLRRRHYHSFSTLSTLSHELTHTLPYSPSTCKLT